MNRIAQLIAVILILVSAPACIPRPPQNTIPKDGNPPASTRQSEPVVSPSDRSGEAANEGLPFSLTIGGQRIDSDLRVSVPEGQGVAIQFLSNGPGSGQMSVVRPGGESVLLGAWQANSAQFNYAFPYGENRLILSYAGKDYDILVVAGAPLPSAQSSTGCEGSYLALTQGAVWNYEETSQSDFTEYWVYRVQDWNQNANGEVRLTIAVEGSSGIERKVDRTALLELVCRSGQIFIDRSVETEQGVETATTYDSNTIYVPQTLTNGAWWQRQGLMEVKQENGDSLIYNVIEKFGCTGREKVTVKAGEFEADRVEYTITRTREGQEIRIQAVTWFVPGLGRVLSEAEGENPARMELVSYENITPRQ